MAKRRDPAALLVDDVVPSKPESILRALIGLEAGLKLAGQEAAHRVIVALRVALTAPEGEDLAQLDKAAGAVLKAVARRAARGDVTADVIAALAGLGYEPRAKGLTKAQADELLKCAQRARKRDRSATDTAEVVVSTLIRLVPRKLPATPVAELKVRARSAVESLDEATATPERIVSAVLRGIGLADDAKRTAGARRVATARAKARKKRPLRRR